VSYGTDYAFYPHPPVAALKAAGVHFVCRYISPDSANDANGKNLLPGEVKALHGAGIAVVVVFESYAGRMKEGKAAGVADAQHAAAVTKALGMGIIPVYFAADWDATPGDQTAINAYLDGVASVIGRDRTGIYGGYYPVKRALDAGKAVWAWQTLAWSGGQWDSRAHIRQGLTVTVGGVQVDVDDSRHADYGQWPRPVPVPPPPPTPPPPGPGPYLHHTSGDRTLAQVAAQRNTSLEALLARSAANWTTADWAAVTAILADLKVAGWPYYTVNA
jgi:hypothetical protein